MSFPSMLGGMGLGGGSAGTMGNAFVRVGGDFRGLHSQTTQAMTRFRGQMQAGTAGMASSTRQFNQQMAEAQRRTSNFGRVVRGLAIGFGTIAVAGGAMAIKAAIDFESAFAGVRKTVEASEEELKRLRQEFRNLAQEIPVSVNELARIGEAAGALGIPTRSIIEFTKVVSTIGTTTNVTTEEAATALGQLSNVLNLTEADYQRFASTLVDLGNKGASTERDILEITRRMGSAAKLFGLTTDQILALGSSAANLGMQPQLAASSLQRLVMRLVSVTAGMDTVKELIAQTGLTTEQMKERVEAGGDTLQKFADQVGYSGKELTKIIAGVESLDALRMALGVTNAEFERMRKNRPQDIIAGLFKAMQGMGPGDRQLFITRLLGPTASAGGGVGLQQLMLGLADSVERNLIPQLRYGTLAWRENVAAVNEAEERYKTTASQLGLLKNTIQDILITVGEGGLPVLVEALGQVREAIPAIFQALSGIALSVQPAIQQVADAAFRLWDVLQDILFDWGGSGRSEGMIGSLNVVATVVQSIADALTLVLDVTTGILSQPMMASLVKFAGLWAGIAIAVKAMTAIRNFAIGAAMGVGNLLGAPLRAMGGSRGGQEMAASSMNMSAAEMQMGAARMQMGAASGRAALGQAVMSRGGIQYVPGPVGPYSANWAGAQRMNLVGSPGAGAARSAQASYGAFARGGALGMGARLGAMGTGIAGVGGAFRTGLSTMGGIIGPAAGLAARAFWPLFIADLVGNLVAAPIGDWIKQNTGMKRVAEAWGKGWMEGIGATWQGFFQGDEWVNRPKSYDFGAAGQVDTDRLREAMQAMEVDAATTNALLNPIETAEAAGNVLDVALAMGNFAEWINANQDKLREAYSKTKANGVTWASGGGLQYAQMDPEGKELGAALTAWFENGGLPFNPADLVENANAKAQQALQGAVREYAAITQQIVDIQPAALSSLGEEQLKSVNSLLMGAQGGRFGGLRSLALRDLLPSFDERSRENGMIDLAKAATEVRKDLMGVTQSMNELKATEPALVEYVNRVWAGPKGFLRQIELANTAAEQTKIINSVFPDAGVKGKDKEQVAQWWSRVLEIVPEAMELSGADQYASIAEGAQMTIADAISKGLKGVKDAPTLRQAVAQMRTALWDRVGTQEGDVQQRVGAALVDELATAVKHAPIKNVRAALEGVLGRAIPNNRSLRSIILASAAPQIEAADTPGEKRTLVKSLRERFPGLGMPKSFRGLRRSLKAPDVEEWRTNLQQITTAVEGTYDPLTGAMRELSTGVETEATKAEQSAKDMGPAFILASGTVGTAAGGFRDAVVNPIKQIPIAISGVVTATGAQLTILAGMVGRAERLAAQAEQAQEPSGAGFRWPWESGGMFGGPENPGKSASGGRAYRAVPRWVGEQGPELFFPGDTGSILSNKRSLEYMAGGRGGGSHQTIYVDRMDLINPGSEDAILAQMQFLSPAGV